MGKDIITNNQEINNLFQKLLTLSLRQGNVWRQQSISLKSIQNSILANI